MKLQISPKKRLADAITVWREKTPDAEIIVNIGETIGLGDESAKTVYCFGLLSGCESSLHSRLAAELRRILKVGGELYIIENDFDHLTRSLIGADLKVEDFNRQFIQQSYLNQAMVVDLLSDAGFDPEKMKVWYNAENFDHKAYELIISTKKDKK